MYLFHGIYYNILGQSRIQTNDASAQFRNVTDQDPGA
jgi:hypothetical protein